jgi:hypothetical protein
VEDHGQDVRVAALGYCSEDVTSGGAGPVGDPGVSQHLVGAGHDVRQIEHDGTEFWIAAEKGGREVAVATADVDKESGAGKVAGLEGDGVDLAGAQ